MNIENLVADKIFTVVFTKANGDERTMNCRLNVKKHLHGGESTTKHISHLLTVFDMQKRAYRNINLKTLKTLKFDNKVFSKRDLGLE